MKKLIIRNEIFLKIQIDVPLRKKIAEYQKTHHMSVRKLCIDKAPKLYDINILNIIKEHTGWTDDEIFEQKK